MKPRLVVWCLAAAILDSGWAAAAKAQAMPPRSVVKIYHGATGEAEAVRLVRDGMSVPVEGGRIATYAPQGAEVCLQVINAHPVYYKYDLGTVIDSSANSIPTIGGAFLSYWSDRVNNLETMNALGLRRNDNAPRLTEALVPEWAEELANVVITLSQEYKLAQQHAAESEAAENYDPVSLRLGEGGIGTAKKQMSLIPKETGHLGSDLKGLRAHLDKLLAEGKKAVPEDQQQPGTFLLDALHAYGVTVASSGEALLSSYAKASSTALLCDTLGASPTTLTLSVRRNQEGISARATGELVRATFKPVYARPRVELFPVAYSVYVRDVSTYSIVNGVVAQEEDAEDFLFRAGGMVAITVLDLGEDRGAAISAGVGSNLIGGDGAMSDLLGTILFSYRDVFRVGLGWGVSQVPSRLITPAKPGQPLPPDRSISDFVGTDDKSGLFLVINLTGIKLPILK